MFYPVIILTLTDKFRNATDKKRGATDKISDATDKIKKATDKHEIGRALFKAMKDNAWSSALVLKNLSAYSSSELHQYGDRFL